MGTFVVVAVSPVFGHAPHLVEAGEDVAVEHFGAVGFVEAFDVGVLGRLAGLDVDELDASDSATLHPGSLAKRNKRVLVYRSTGNRRTLSLTQ